MVLALARALQCQRHEPALEIPARAKVAARLDVSRMLQLTLIAPAVEAILDGWRQAALHSTLCGRGFS
jgi:hypothetical protein